MPELPEVETVCRGIAPVLEGRTLTKIAIRQTKLRLPVPADLADRLQGNRVVRVGRRAKYILIEMSDGAVVLAHLGMSGRMSVIKGKPPAPGPHDHIDFVTDDGVTVRFTDPRKFGLVTLDHVDTIDRHKLLAHLGPDPTSNAFNAIELAGRLKGRKNTIKAALLDQKIVSGIGNIYASESLFRAGLSPRRKAGTVQGGRAEKLTQAIRNVLAEAIEAGGSTLRDHISPDGELGYFQHQFKVYGQEGKSCPGCDCDVLKTGGVQRIVQSNRSTFYCAKRQR